MRKRIMITAVLLGLSAAVIAYADEQQTSAPADEQEQAAQAVQVGNKICPVSGEKVGEMGEIVQIEHNGKIYNLCCAMCNKDFNKDPDKYSKIADDEAAASVQENK